MKNKTFKLFLVFSLVFLMTGCTKILTDENKKTVKTDDEGFFSKLLAKFKNL